MAPRSSTAARRLAPWCPWSTHVRACAPATAAQLKRVCFAYSGRRARAAGPASPGGQVHARLISAPCRGPTQMHCMLHHGRRSNVRGSSAANNCLSLTSGHVTHATSLLLCVSRRSHSSKQKPLTSGGRILLQQGGQRTAARRRRGRRCWARAPRRTSPRAGRRAWRTCRAAATRSTPRSGAARGCRPSSQQMVRRWFKRLVLSRGTD